jgi:hypothetical protein
MTIDRTFIGYRHPEFSVVVDAEKVRRFADAIGLRHEATASADLPPTYLKVIEGEGNSSREILNALGVDLKSILHAEQEFEYGEPAHPGDVLTVRRVVTDIYERKQGALEFIVVESSIAHVNGALVGRSRQSILVRNSNRTAAG